MLKSLRLKNFRGFVDHAIDFAPFTLLTGRNNAGKTTIIEALRVISVAQSKARNARFQMAPDEYEGQIGGPLFRFSLKTLDFDEQNVHHNYRVDEISLIQATFTNNCKISVFLGRENSDRLCQFQLAGGRKVNSKGDAVSAKFHRIFVMPPVGSLLDVETERDKKYLQDNINGYLSYRHLRNQMAEMPEQYEVFKQSLEATWPGLDVQSLGLVHDERGSRYELRIRDGRYPAEVARLGSGLQAWIQTLWFLARVDPNSIIVLDEPDVYLHADLQKKLIRLLGSSPYRQKVVATHSIEMISDASPEEVIVVEKSRSKSQAISSSKSVQALLKQLGTSHHIQLSKLADAGKVLFVEGKDHKFLGLVAAKIGRAETFEKIPRFSIGGAANWHRAAIAAEVLHAASQGEVCAHLILDRDYHLPEKFEEIQKKSAEVNLHVTVWGVKEIENFFIDEETIYQIVHRNSQKKVDREVIVSMVRDAVDELYQDLHLEVGQSLQMADRRLAMKTAASQANEIIKGLHESGSAPADLVSGKAFFHSLSRRTQEEFGVSISPTSVCREIPIERLEPQIRSVVESFCS